MSYNPLHRKYRPQNFNEVVGHDGIKTILQNGYAQDKLPQAILFVSPKNLPGIGKTTMARILAKLWNCEDPNDNEPCNECTQCKRINKESHPDIIEVDAASNSGVADMRKLLEVTDFGAQMGSHTVLILDEVHMLSNAASNALLKTLEEPPEHVKFILATTEADRIPRTIISRTMRFDLKPISSKRLLDFIEYVADEEGIDYESTALKLLAETFDGSVRNALMKLEEVMLFSGDTITVESVEKIIGQLSLENLFEITDAIMYNKKHEFAESLLDLYKLGFDEITIINILSNHITNLAAIYQGVNKVRLTPDMIQKYQEKIQEYQGISWNDILNLFNHWGKVITQWKGRIALEHFSFDLYDAWNTGKFIPKKDIIRLANLFKGRVASYSEEKSTIITALDNKLQIVLDPEQVDTEHYCVYPDDVFYMLNHEDEDAKIWLDKNIIKEK